MSNFTTNCKKCCFAIFNEVGQVGCKVGRLTKFIDMDKAVWTDDDYFVIQQVCNTSRSKRWAQEQHEDLIEAVMKEVEFRGDFVIVSHDDDDAEQKIYKSVKQCVAQDMDSHKIIVSVKNDKLKYYDLFKSLEEMCQPIPFQLVRIANTEDNDLWATIDGGMKKSTGVFSLLFGAGKNIPTNLISNINKIINEDLRKVSMIVNREDILSGLVIQTELYRHVRQYREFHKVIEEVAKEQGSSSMIIDWEEVCPTE